MDNVDKFLKTPVFPPFSCFFLWITWISVFPKFLQHFANLCKLHIFLIFQTRHNKFIPMFTAIHRPKNRAKPVLFRPAFRRSFSDDPPHSLDLQVRSGYVLGRLIPYTAFQPIRSVSLVRSAQTERYLCPRSQTSYFKYSPFSPGTR